MKENANDKMSKWLKGLGGNETNNRQQGSEEPRDRCQLPQSHKAYIMERFMRME